MGNTPNNFDDLKFLMSRSLDGDLSGEDSARLENALADRVDLRTARDEMAAIDRLVKEWGNRPVEIDWTAHRALIESRVVCNAKAENDSSRVDNLLTDWAKQDGIGDVDLRGRVLAEIRGANRVAKPLRWVIRLGLPLAAAAAIAIAVLLPNVKDASQHVSPSIVSFVRPSGTESTFASSATTTVLFDRTVILTRDVPSGGSMELIVVGSPPKDVPVEESAPL